MVECIVAWICLAIGFITQNPNYFIASGAFAVAAQIYLHRKGGASDGRMD